MQGFRVASCGAQGTTLNSTVDDLIPALRIVRSIPEFP